MAELLDGPRWSLHHRLLYRLVLGAPGSTTEELNYLYDAVAPLVYHGTTLEAIAPRTRWERRNALVDADLVDSYDTPSGRVWVPLQVPDDLEVRFVAREARAYQQQAD